MQSDNKFHGWDCGSPDRPCPNGCECWCHSPSVTMRELVHADRTLDYGRMTFDYALPVRWCDDFKSKTGQWPNGYVWAYPAGSIFGEPHPVTYEAAVALTLYRSKA